ncbi:MULTISPECIES: GIY-YIG nuclease family protein [Nocardia]|uniref:GIY-YIG nuclease family protein n=1 Tax=Nocardia TaxID=1817 RepID=UPI000D68FC47|nr:MULTISPECIES: GIY-YIG nuclease family protein [Nocardia]
MSEASTPAAIPFPQRGNEMAFKPSPSQVFSAPDGAALEFFGDGDTSVVQASVLARQLGHRDASNMIRGLEDDEKVLVLAPDGPAGSLPAWYLTAAGAYKALTRCRLSSIPDPAVRSAVGEFQQECIRQGSLAVMDLLGSIQDVAPAWTRSTSRIDERPVYFIRDAAAGEVKIGISHDPKARLRAIQSTRPNPLELVLVIPTGGIQLERRLHGRFAKYRLYSEWFREANPVRDFIRNESQRMLSGAA